MGHCRIWKVALLAVLFAMIVGFGKLEQRKKQHRIAETGAPTKDAEPDKGDFASKAHDPVSQFLTELVGEDPLARTATGSDALPAVPLIAELPPLPEAFWPVPNLITRAFPPDAVPGTY